MGELTLTHIESRIFASQPFSELSSALRTAETLRLRLIERIRFNRNDVTERYGLRMSAYQSPKFSAKKAKVCCHASPAAPRWS